MGRLVIAHHKSYHPYRRDNVERVRRDEEEAAQAEAREDGRVLLADSEARIGLLRERAGGSRVRKRDDEKAEMERAVANAAVDTSGLPLIGGHINFFGDLEQSTMSSAIQASVRAKKAPALTQETDKGVRLAPAEKDLKPWYTVRGPEREKVGEVSNDRRNRDLANKSNHDPLTLINSHLSSRGSIPTSASHGLSHRRPPHASLSATSSISTSASSPASTELASRLTRESSERERARALIAKRKRELAGSETPSTVHGGYMDMYNREEVEEAKRDRNRGWREHAGHRDRGPDRGVQWKDMGWGQDSQRSHRREW